MLVNYKLYFVTTFLLVSALCYLQATTKRETTWEADRINGMYIDAWPEEDLHHIKYKHALENERYDVGVFGNSRAVMLQKSDVLVHENLSDVTFYNFSIPSTSFRNSLNLMESLSSRGKLPRLSIISFDNAVIQYADNGVEPLLLNRWGILLKEVLMYFVDQEISFHDFAYISWRHLLVEWRQFKKLFDFNLLLRRNGISDFDTGTYYRSDGSQILDLELSDENIKPITTPSNFVLLSYLDYDLKRVAQLKKDGAEIIIYESPIYPDIEAPTLRQIKNTRDKLYQACKKYEINCYASPNLEGNSGSNKWSDSSHAPAPILGGWLYSLISPYL